MRLLPFLKPTKGVQIAGGGFPDSGGGGGSFTPPAFSTSEFNTGYVWTDGKPIYGKVVPLTQSSTQSSHGTLSNYSDVDTIVFSFATTVRSDGNPTFLTSVSSEIDTDYDGGISVSWNTSISDSATGHCIIFYTKKS